MFPNFKATPIFLFRRAGGLDEEDLQHARPEVHAYESLQHQIWSIRPKPPNMTVGRNDS